MLACTSQVASLLAGLQGSSQHICAPLPDLVQVQQKIRTTVRIMNACSELSFLKDLFACIAERMTL